MTSHMPQLVGQTWNWMHDGSNVNGQWTFNADGTVDAFGYRGTWRAIDTHAVETTHNAIVHIIKLDKAGCNGDILFPERHPMTRMKSKRSECLNLNSVTAVPLSTPVFIDARLLLI